MSRFSTLFSAVARPHLLHHLGETVTRYPLGVVGSAISGLTGIFNEENPNHQTQDGERVLRKATLRVESSVAPDKRDSWLILGEVWTATTVMAAVGGLILVGLERTDRILTNGNQGITQL